MNNSIFSISIAALLPAVAAVIIYLLDKKTALSKINPKAKQIIIGIIFGILAILGTEWGIPYKVGAQLNCRDAAVLVAGLMFGGPAGIIAGFIGGIERFIAVAWGVGTYTRVACSLSTIIAGFYSAALRKYMFEDKKPTWLLSFAIGIVMEVFHLTMVFITNVNTAEKAMEVVMTLTIPMLLANGLSVMVSGIALTFVAGEFKRERAKSARISQTVQRWLFLTVIIAFLVTSAFIFGLQNQLAKNQTETTLKTAAEDVALDILDASDRNILEIAHKVSQEAELGRDINEIAEENDLSEISYINDKGVIYKSTVPSYIGFDMSSGEQAKEFLCLLGDTEQYVQAYGPITSDPNISRKYAGVKTTDGFIQVGYDAERFQKDIDTQVTYISQNRHVGKTGYVIIANNNLDIVCAPEEIGAIELQNKGKLPEEGKVFNLLVDGTVNRAMFNRSTEGYIIISVLPQAEAIEARDLALYVNTFMEVLVFAVLFALVYLLIKRVVVNQIKEINSSLSMITDGNLDVVVDVRSNEEFASLSDDINKTVDTLKRYIDEASARIDEELNFAKNIQASALPSVFPAFPQRPEIDIYASMDPAKEVGGDFYDFYFTHMYKFNFLVADVSGKGIPAAMFMMRAKTELKSLTEADMPIEEVFTHGNAALCEGNDAGMFVTAWQGSIDLQSGLVKYANAGHNPPLVRHADGKFEYLHGRPGFVLAGMDTVKYKPQELQLGPGDIVFVYTDGVTEATNAEQELYGEDRLLAAANSKYFESAEELCHYIKADVDAFVGDAPQFDDITMVAFRFLGIPEVPSITFAEAKIDDITAVTAFVEEEFEKRDISPKVTVTMSIAIDEIYSNIVKYGYRDTVGPVKVEIIEKQEPHAICVKFIDMASPYNPLMKKDPDITLSAEERGIGGLGIFMVKKSMDDVKYRYENGQNVLTLIKNLDD
ncbi:MAG: SpoIIE family protein phosphatase [Clostridia bacterium]|nr:SpoIIE family protein phosphatase [Clostridia bacterium]